MTTSASPRITSFRTPLLLVVAAAFAASAAPLSAAVKPTKEEKRAAKREAIASDAGTTAKTPTDADGNPAPEAADKAKGKNNTPETAQARTLEKLRTKLEITDDGEWTIIAERIAKVEEVKRSMWTSAGPGRNGLAPAAKAKGASNTLTSANTDRAAINSAVTDKLPDAEIKSRLLRAHDIQQQNEVALAKAQSELRAVLTVRQEAVMVLAGLLAP